MWQRGGQTFHSPKKLHDKISLPPTHTCTALTVPASWPAKRHFGTIWVHRGEHPSLTHHFKSTSPPIFKQLHPNSFLAKTETFLRVAPRARVAKISSGRLAGQAPVGNQHNQVRETANANQHAYFTFMVCIPPSPSPELNT